VASRVSSYFCRTYATLDERGLAAGRISLALVLLADLAKRASGVSTWYSNDGLLPNHTVLWSPPYDYLFSPFFNFSHAYEAALGMLLCAVAYLGLLVGYRTKLSQLLSFVAVLGLHGRVMFLEMGGDVVLSNLAFWTLFLPLGRRYSLDASSRGAAASTHGVSSLACFLLRLQLVVIYLFNALQKNGDSWRDGSAVHYALQLDSMVTWLGVLVRGQLTPSASAWLTYGTLAVEALAPILLLFPVRNGVTRTLAVALLLPLHLGFSTFINVGLFSFAMLAYLPFLLPGFAWDAFERRWPVLGRAPAGGPVHAPAEPAPTPLRARLRLGALLAALGLMWTQLSVENPAMPARLRLPQPTLARALVHYLQLFQGWTMFAPYPPKIDYALSVDAVTADGRHVDPFNEEFRSGRSPPRDGIPVSLGYDVFANRYVERIADSPAYHTAFGEWILRYPERTGRTADRIVTFTVRALEDHSPAPGRTLPTQPRSYVVFASAR